MKKNYYELIGLEPSASQTEIDDVCITIARQYHPDKTAGDLNAKIKFKEIEEAYETLGNPEKRKLYDENLKESLADSAKSEPGKSANQDVREISPFLILGIIFLPFIFCWPLLRKGYSNNIKVIAFGYLIFVVIFAFMPNLAHIKPHTSNSTVSQPEVMAIYASPKAKNAISALKNVDTRLDIGLTYLEYRKLISDTWIEVKPYYETISENDVDLYVEVAAAMDDYREALGVWEFIFKESLFNDSLGDNSSTKLLLTGNSGSTSKGQYFMAYLPSIVKNGPSVAAMEATHYAEDANGKFKYIDLKEMQQLQWKDAKERLAKIDKLTK